jgi:hypothetical protein
MLAVAAIVPLLPSLHGGRTPGRAGRLGVLLPFDVRRSPMLQAGDPSVTAEEVVVDLLFVMGGALALVVLVLVIVGAWRG